MRMPPKSSARLLCCLAITVIGFTIATSIPASALSGAGFTTFDTTLKGCLDNPTGVDCNNYAAKTDVFMNGGPTAGGIQDGCYYFSVLVPGDQNGGFLDGATGNLSDTTVGGTAGDLGSGDLLTNRTFCVTGHLITSYSGSHLEGTDPQGDLVIQLAPFDDTSNPGGVYILAICQVGATSPSQCKFDAFRAPLSVPPPPPSVGGILRVCKYYDANADGINNTGDSLIAWDFELPPDPSTVADTGVNTCVDYQFTSAQTVTVQEGDPIQTNWFNSDPGPDPTPLVPGTTVVTKVASVTVDVAPFPVTEVDFGNFCTGAGGGLTIGFWSNKNGQALITSGDLTNLDNLCLRNATGGNFDPTTKAAYKSWLLNATATNMAYMLSAQLSGMELNVAHGFVSSTALVLAGSAPAGCSIPGLSGAGVISISNLMTDANNELCADGYTIATGTAQQQQDRTCQEFKKNALDNANNNLNFIEAASSCPATFDLDPTSTTYSFPPLP